MLLIFVVTDNCFTTTYLTLSILYLRSFLNIVGGLGVVVDGNRRDQGDGCQMRERVLGETTGIWVRQLFWDELET